MKIILFLYILDNFFNVWKFISSVSPGLIAQAPSPTNAANQTITSYYILT